MKHNCNDHLTLISYKWNNKDGTIKYVYMCKICNKTFEYDSELNISELQQMICNPGMYNKFNL